MNDFVVIGLGNFGFHIAKKLAEKGKNVLAIDSNPEQVEHIKDIVNDSVIGDVKNKSFLAEFVDKKTGAAIISTGENMFGSILAVHHLKELGVKNIIVKAIDETHAQLLKIMGADEIIFPEKDIAEWWANKLVEPNLLENLPISSEYSIVEYACPDEFAGKNLKSLQLLSKHRILILGIKDILKDEIMLIPDGDYTLKPDTILMLLGKKEDISRMKLKI